MKKLKTAKNNKARGKTTEREFVSILNEEMRKAELLDSTEAFYRTEQSGARRHVRQKLPREILLTMTGDIHGPTDFPFVVESKGRRSNPDFHKLVCGQKHDIHDWIDQVTADAEEMDKLPLLLMKFASRGMMAAVRASEYETVFRFRSNLNHYALINFYHKGRAWVIINIEGAMEIVKDIWRRQKEDEKQA